MFFFVSLGLSTIGPGNIATTAIIAPMAMAVGARAMIPPFLTALMVGNGAQAGALSPFAPTGVIVNGIMDRIGLAGHQWQTFGNNLFAHAIVTFVAYFAFGGLRLFTARPQPSEIAQSDQAGARADAELVDAEPFTWVHWVTLAILVSLVLVVVVFEMNVGMAALTGASILSFCGAGNEKEAIRKMPWGVVLMVCGVTVLIGVLEKTQGMTLFTDLLAKLSSPGTVSLVIAFVTGVVSVYSSTSGVVLPAFLPTVPGLVERLGGADPLRLRRPCMSAATSSISHRCLRSARCASRRCLTAQTRGSCSINFWRGDCR
jgi:Na+/H+ antiporter NhaD/arsenite permease-like protein